MSEWITDRKPTEGDIAAPHYCVYDSMGCIVHYKLVGDGEPWKPVPKCEPYVKPKRWEVIWDGYNNCWKVRDWTFEFGGMLCNCLRTQEHREAAERIAAIYEEVIP